MQYILIHAHTHTRTHTNTNTVLEKEPIEKYWIPRAALLSVLKDRVSKSQNIKVMYETSVKDVKMYNTDGVHTQERTLDRGAILVEFQKEKEEVEMKNEIITVTLALTLTLSLTLTLTLSNPN